VITDAQGTVLAVHTTPANVRDDQAVPALLGKLGAGDAGPRRPTASLHGDAGYGFPHTARQIAAADIEPVLAARGSPGPRPPGLTPPPTGDEQSGLGAIRWVVEQTLALLGHFRRLKVCYERTGAHFQALHDLAATLLCFIRLRHYINEAVK
jgi:transposase